MKTKTKRNGKILLTAGLLGLATLSACSAQVDKPAAPTVETSVEATKKGGIRTKAITIRAKVEKVDQKSRKVSLLGFDGTRETLRVGDDVKNLAQVRKGDEVVVTYYQAAAFEVLAKGEKKADPSAVAGIATAEPGEMPGGVAAQVTTLVVDVLKLDPENSTATIRGPEGDTLTIDIRNPVVFDKVKVGDRVEVTLAEAMAVDVQGAAAK